MNNEIVTYSFLKKYVMGNWESTFISLKMHNTFHMKNGIMTTFQI